MTALTLPLVVVTDTLWPLELASLVSVPISSTVNLSDFFKNSGASTVTPLTLPSFVFTVTLIPLLLESFDDSVANAVLQSFKPLIADSIIPSIEFSPLPVNVDNTFSIFFILPHASVDFALAVEDDVPKPFTSNLTTLFTTPTLKVPVLDESIAR